jgi:hypothetical protein
MVISFSKKKKEKKNTNLTLILYFLSQPLELYDGIMPLLKIIFLGIFCS